MFLRQDKFHFQGQEEFSYFALKGPFRGQEQGSGKLLGDRAGALDFSTVFEVRPCGPKDSPDVQSRMFEKPGIFNGNHGIDQMLGHVTKRSQYSSLHVILADNLAVIRFDLGNQARLVIPESTQRGQSGCHMPGHRRCRPDGQSAGDQDGPQQTLHQTPGFRSGEIVRQQRAHDRGGSSLVDKAYMKTIRPVDSKDKPSAAIFRSRRTGLG